MNKYKNRIVVKVGTSSLTNERGQNRYSQFDRLAAVLSDIQNMGYEVILVSSGAIAIGGNKLRLEERPTELKLKQAAAAVGQSSLMFFYDKYFKSYDKTVAQILLIEEDILIEERKQNLLNVFNSLLEMDIIPIVNENDSVGYSEIQSSKKLFGDNDKLSAFVAILCQASQLVILSDIDGLYDKDPRIAPDATLLERVDYIDESIQLIAGGAGSRRGTGGMVTKMEAAKLATEQGIETIITNGNRPESLYKIIQGEAVGTVFTPQIPSTFTKAN